MRVESELPGNLTKIQYKIFPFIGFLQNSIKYYREVADFAKEVLTKYMLCVTCHENFTNATYLRQFYFRYSSPGHQVTDKRNQY
jgi:hypothetical protein